MWGYSGERFKDLEILPDFIGLTCLIDDHG